MKLLIINGPNINMLGIREREIYGTQTYEELCLRVKEACAGIDYEIFQSNHEGALIDKIQGAYGSADGIVINPGAYTHTSIALLDALRAVSLPTVEVHISDINAREDFRKISLTALYAEKTVSGKGIEGYAQAIDYLRRTVGGRSEKKKTPSE